MKMDPVVHFEMPAEDQKRMGEFYAKVFGWKTQMMGEDMGNYMVVTTTESDEKGPKKPGAINGGFYKKTKEMGSIHPSIVIAVENIKEHIKKIEHAGGKILGEPMDIPGVGMYTNFIDTEGNRVGVLQPSPMMQKK